MSVHGSVFRLGDWVVDAATGEIRRGEDRARIEPRPMAVLLLLAEEPGAVVSKDELMAAVWADACVGEDSVWRAIYGLRKALGDDGEARRYIETVPKRGYRLVAPVAPTQARAGEDGAGPPESGRRGVRRRLAAWRWAATMALLACALMIAGDRQVGEVGADLERPEPAADRGGVRILATERSAAEFLELGRRHYDGRTTAYAYTTADLERAVALFEKAVARDPNLAAAYAELAGARGLLAVKQMWDRQGLEEARDTALTALELDPDLPEAYRALGMIEQKLGQLKESQAAYERAVELRPSYVEALEGLTVTYTLRGRVWEGLEIRRRLLDSDRPPAQLLGNLGWSLLLVGELEEAGRYFRAALDHEPFQIVATIGLGDLYHRAGDLQSARELLEAAVEVHPDSSSLLAVLGGLAHEVGDLERARALLERATSSPGTSQPEAWVLLVVVLRDLGETERADRILEALEAGFLPRLGEDNDLYLPRYYLAAVYALMDRPDEALDLLAQAIELGPVQAEPMRRSPAFDAVRDDPRFEALARRAEQRTARR